MLKQLGFVSAMPAHNSTKQSWPGLNPWKWLLGALVLILLLQVVDHWLDWATLAEAWQELDKPKAMIGVALIIASHLLRGLRIHWLLKERISSRFHVMIKLSAWHQFTNNLLPMRLGEAAFPILMKRYYGVTALDSVSQLVWLRMLDLLFMAAVTTSVLLLIKPLLGVAALVAVALMLALGEWLLALNRQHRSLPPLLSRFRWLNTALQALLQQAPHSNRQQLQLIAITAASWLSKLLAVCIAISLFSSLPLIPSLAGAIASELAGILPIHGIAGSGSFEAAFYSGISLVEGFSADWLAVAINVHIFLFASTTLMALFCSLIPVVTAKQPVGEHDL
ncbi:lysylphosphatidylglycerol synthase transmembrane domain-containing protein [Halioxenophilus sp. WMMB6]|uniref:lysylphosphatidylglycerol synthase transmembrane domain-containing protein n=1 Tax=Halioxenophilus sp. WMMB6 TaxID=3073815 RepID=UPI00295EA1E0|nr:lysylphosphatidylglycerol synthase transmembrane domain-containing protein [Halioxenophilus sp. WMMB6]